MVRQILYVWLMLSPYIVHAGALADAPPLTTGLTKILDFLLLVFGAIAILGMLVVGMLYLSAQGDERQALSAKRAFTVSVKGVVIALGSMVLVWTIARLLAN